MTNTSVRVGDIERVLRGIEVAEEVGFQDIQINAVLSPETSMTLDDRVDFCEKIWGRGWTPRWIEMMPIGGLKAQMGGESSITVRAHLHEHFDLRPLPSSSPPSPLSSSISGPARYWEVSSGRYQGHRVGFIDPLSDDGFCSTCNRVRLTARGGLRACLADDSEVNLKSPLRAGFTGLLLIPFIEEALYGKRPAHLMTAGELPAMIMTGIGG